MRTVRVIPCLDVDAGRVVKGVRFVDLVDAGDPVELADPLRRRGSRRAGLPGHHRLVGRARAPWSTWSSRTAEQVFIPFTVGGGVRTVEDARRLLRAGADKVGVNTAAVDRPGLVAELADEFGAQCVVVAIDARRRAGAPSRAGRSSPTGAAPRPAWTPWRGPSGARRSVRVRSCSPPWTATAPGTASTSS